MDILKYAIFKAANDAQICIASGANTSAQTAGSIAGCAAGNTFGCPISNNYIAFAGPGAANDIVFWTQANLSSRLTCSQCTQYYLNTTPWCYCYWLGIPRFPNSSNTSNAGINPVTGTEYSGFKVCSANLWSGNTGTCCAWTVPAGTSYARFQIWGAGGGAGSGCCCGGSTWGTNGAYASVIIPVGPGSTYTLCAGSAWCAPICWGNNLCIGCSSYVIGPGLCNFCAQGAPWKNHWCHIGYDLGVMTYISGCCRWNSADCFQAGACICNSGSDYCFSNSCAWCGWIGPSANKVTNYYGNTSVVAANVSIVANITGAASNTYFQVGGQVLGIPGLNTLCECFDTSFYGCSTAPPTYGFELSSGYVCGICLSSASGGGPAYNKLCGIRVIPGAGGTYVHLMAGCTLQTGFSCIGTLCGGDLGRDGMVCVTYF
jgi:hypothetical protein